MNYKNHELTFEKTMDFDGQDDSMIAGSKELITGKCVQYTRSGWHKWWIVIDKEGKEHHFNTTFDTLKLIDGKAI